MGILAVGVDVTLCANWLEQALRDLTHYEQTLNDLNVFPIPDSDTGSNLVLTLRSGLAAAPAPQTSGSSVAHWLLQVGEGAAMQARGNSGSLLSQYLSGFAQGMAQLAGTKTSFNLSDSGLNVLLTQADIAISRALVDPVAGTIVDVSWAARAYTERHAGRGQSPLQFLNGLYDACQQALADTPRHLAVLRQRGVVDAGGFGLLVCIHALVRNLGVQPSALVVPEPRVTNPDTLLDLPALGPVFELMFLASQQDTGLEELRLLLDSAGDSVAMSQAQGFWNAHVHLDDPQRFITDQQWLRWQNIRVSDVAGGATSHLAICPHVGLIDALVPGFAGVLLREDDTELTDSEVEWLASSLADGSNILVTSELHRQQLEARGVAASQVRVCSWAGLVLRAQQAQLLQTDSQAQTESLVQPGSQAMPELLLPRFDSNILDEGRGDISDLAEAISQHEHCEIIVSVVCHEADAQDIESLPRNANTEVHVFALTRQIIPPTNSGEVHWVIEDDSLEAANGF